MLLKRVAFILTNFILKTLYFLTFEEKIVRRGAITLPLISYCPYAAFSREHCTEKILIGFLWKMPANVAGDLTVILQKLESCFVYLSYLLKYYSCFKLLASGKKKLSFKCRSMKISLFDLYPKAILVIQGYFNILSTILRTFFWVGNLKWEILILLAF